jgi:hypothetical protein
MAIDARQQDEFSKFDYLLEIELEEFRRYTVGLEESIIKTQSETKKWIDEEIWPDKTENIPYKAIEISNHVEVFTPNLFYKSTLTALYSFFESCLRELVKTARDKRGLKIKIEDLRGNGIAVCRDYLIKVIEIDVISLEGTWSRINDVRHVRNSIVHNEYESLDPEKAKLLLKICSANPSLEYLDAVTIKTSQYLTEFIDDIYDYLKGLIELLRSAELEKKRGTKPIV